LIKVSQRHLPPLPILAIVTYWNIGKRIVEEEQAGAARAQYGKENYSCIG